MKELFSSVYQADCKTAEELNHQYHYFVSKISHEIRNPLTLIHSSLQLIEKKHPELPNTDLWGQLRREVEDTISLLNELSSFHKDDSIKQELIRPASFLASVDAVCRPSMEACQIEFDTYTVNKIPPFYADALRLKEALLNLLRNAQDAVNELQTVQDNWLESLYYNCSYYTRNHAKRIELYMEYTGFFINFHVRDNGTGIPPEYADTLFEPFVTHKRSGTGLGLSIVKNIASLHDGSVTFLTNSCPPGTYTDVCLSIPVK